MLGYISAPVGAIIHAELSFTPLCATAETGVDACLSAFVGHTIFVHIGVRVQVLLCNLGIDESTGKCQP